LIFIYEKFIDPLLSKIREKISEIVSNSSTVIDIGFGTGALVFELANKCKKVIGIEISEKLVKHALQQKEKRRINNVEFFLSNESFHQKLPVKKFDYGIACMVFHTISEDERISLLKKIKSLALKIILVDYEAPLPKNSTGITIRMIEFIAGKEHFFNFKSFIKSGGLYPLIDEMGLKIEEKYSFMNGAIALLKIG